MAAEPEPAAGRPRVGRLGSLLDIWRAREEALAVDRAARWQQRAHARVRKAQRRSSSLDGQIHTFLRRVVKAEEGGEPAAEEDEASAAGGGKGGEEEEGEEEEEEKAASPQQQQQQQPHQPQAPPAAAPAAAATPPKKRMSVLAAMLSSVPVVTSKGKPRKLSVLAMALAGASLAPPRQASLASSAPTTPTGTSGPSVFGLPAVAGSIEEEEDEDDDEEAAGELVLVVEEEKGADDDGDGDDDDDDNVRVGWPRRPEDVDEQHVRRLVRAMARHGHDHTLLSRVLPASDLKRLLKQATNALSALPNVVTAEVTPGTGEAVVVGDTHGQFYDLAHILASCGYPGERRWYVFNGDFVDRGAWGAETVVTVLALFVAFPGRVFLTRGNHETRYCTEMYGFRREALYKYSARDYHALVQVFARLPLACLVVPAGAGAGADAGADAGGAEGRGCGLFVVHGGLFRTPSGALGTIEELQRVNRVIADPDEGALDDVLWSDPEEAGHLAPNSMRGAGAFFGPGATAEFLERHGLAAVVRSHEGPDARRKRPHLAGTMMEGYSVDHRAGCGRATLVTVFSAPDYPQGPENHGNNGAVLLVRFEAGGGDGEADAPWNSANFPHDEPPHELLRHAAPGGGARLRLAATQFRAGPRAPQSELFADLGGDSGDVTDRED